MATLAIDTELMNARELVCELLISKLLPDEFGMLPKEGPVIVATLEILRNRLLPAEYAKLRLIVDLLMMSCRSARLEKKI